MQVNVFQMLKNPTNRQDGVSHRKSFLWAIPWPQTQQLHKQRVSKPAAPWAQDGLAGLPGRPKHHFSFQVFICPATLSIAPHAFRPWLPWFKVLLCLHGKLQDGGCVNPEQPGAIFTVEMQSRGLHTKTGLCHLNLWSTGEWLDIGAGHVL